MLQDLRARLQKLESYPASGLTLMQSVFSAGGIAGITYSSLPGNEWQYLAGADVPQATFTIVRPQPILVLGSIGGFGGTGGTASYIQMTCGILPTPTSLVAANDIHGTPMRCADMFQTNGSGLANASVNMCFTMAAGTYTVSWGYFMQGGAVTTLGIQSNQLNVFQVAG